MGDVAYVVTDFDGEATTVIAVFLEEAAAEAFCNAANAINPAAAKAADVWYRAYYAGLSDVFREKHGYYCPPNAIVSDIGRDGEKAIRREVEARLGPQPEYYSGELSVEIVPLHREPAKSQSHDV